MANGVYWIGQDGNYYVKADTLDGVVNLGADPSTNQQQSDFLNDPGITRIDDPNATKQTDEAPSDTSGDGSAALVQAGIDNTQKAIGSLDTELDTGYGNIGSSYENLINKYDRERSREKGEYEQEGVTNKKNLTRNKQNALLAAAQGRKGLRGTLASIGALSGDGSFLADNAVRTSANQDIGEAADTYATNAQSLDKAWSRFDEEDKDRRREAETSKSNQRTALEGRVAGKRQDYYQKMAELFGEAGNTSKAQEWMDKAGDLNDVIARKTAVASTPFSAKTAAFTPGSLESYLAGAGDMTVDVRRGGAGNDGGRTSIFAGRGRREREKEEERSKATA